MHVRYNSSYISLPSPAQQQLEMTKFCVFLENANNVFSFRIERLPHIFSLNKFYSEETIVIFEGKIYVHFLLGVVPEVVVIA